MRADDLEDRDNRNQCKFLSIYSYVGIAVTFLFPTSAINSASGLPIIEWILASSALVIIPLGLKASIQNAGPYHPKSFWKLVVYFQPLAGLLFIISLLLDVGTPSGAVSLIWAANSILIFLIGIQKIFLRGFYIHEETFIDVGLIYLPVGAIWFSASRWGIDLLGFSPLLVTLTAIHFHIAGLGASMMTGQLGRIIKQKSPTAYLTAGSIISLTPILVAVGINSSPLVEVAMASLLAIGVVILAVLSIRVFIYEIFNNSSRIKKFLFATLSVSQSISLFTMTLTCVFAYGEYREAGMVSLSQMLHYHGFLNYFGFVAPSLICLGLLGIPRSNTEEYIPFQRFFGSTYIGADYFNKYNFIDPKSEFHKGLYNDFFSLFLRNHVKKPTHNTVLRYFDDTSNVELICQAKWLPGFKFISPLVHHLGRGMGQLVLPSNNKIQRIRCKLYGLGKQEGLAVPQVSCVRTYEDGTPMHVTSYSAHRIDNKTYMNISLPIPLGQLHSILEISAINGNEDVTGLRITSISNDRLDAGLWLDFKFLRIKIPLHEHLHMWDSKIPKELSGLDFEIDTDNASVAGHTFWIFGIKCLVLNYAILNKDSENLERELFIG